MIKVISFGRNRSTAQIVEIKDGRSQTFHVQYSKDAGCYVHIRKDRHGKVVETRQFNL